MQLAIHKEAYMHNSWSINAGLETCLDVNVSCHVVVHNPFWHHFQCAYHAIIYAAQAVEL
jgi:hypothetical protein